MEQFYSSIGYELTLIKNSLEVLGAKSNFIYQQIYTYTQEDDTFHKKMCFNDKLSNDSIDIFLKNNLLPLLFTSSFKVLDMFMEYILRLNAHGNRIPWRFQAKIAEIESNIENILIPNCIERWEFKNLFLVYKNLTDNRNTIIHKNWGRINDENLIFNNGNIIRYDEVMAICNIVLILSELLNVSQDDLFFKPMKNTLDINIKAMQRIIGNQVDIDKIFTLYYEISYRVVSSLNEKINVNRFREYMQKEIDVYSNLDGTNKYRYLFKLIILSNDIPHIYSSRDLDNINIIEVNGENFNLY